MRFWIKKLELPGRVDFNRVESHAGSAYPIPNKRKQKKDSYCKITGSKPPLDFQRSAHCTGWCTALVPFVSSMASIFRVGYEARYTVSHSSFRSVLPGKCSIIRKIIRDVEEKGAREICSQTFLTDRNDSLELSAFFIRSEEIDLSWHATPSKIEIPSFLFPLPQLEFTYAG